MLLVANTKLWKWCKPYSLSKHILLEENVDASAFSPYFGSITLVRKSIQLNGCSNTKMRSKSMDWFLYDRDLRHEAVNIKN